MTTDEVSQDTPTTIAVGRVVAVINAKAGTARAADRGVLTSRVEAAAARLGTVEGIRFVEPRRWSATLRELAARPDVDTIVVGGGDGSVSSAGTILAGTGKTMAVIPLGTFNLFARSLRIPAGFDAALDALPNLVPTAVDVGEMTDGAGVSDLFLHHLSLGFHPRFIEIRDAMPFASRWGKILASMRVWMRSVRSLSRFAVAFDGDVTLPRRRYYQVALTVGSFREGFGDFPHAEDLTAGDLDLILLPARSRLDFVLAAIQVALGRWRSNPRLEVTPIRRITLSGRRRRVAISVDGEVSRHPLPIAVKVRPKALKVLMMPPSAA